VNFLEGVVLAVALDKKNLKILAESGETLHERLDIAAFIPAGNDDRGRQAPGRTVASRSGNDIVSQAGASQDGHGSHIPVQQSPDAK
jgi:hypothetical protein